MTSSPRIILIHATRLAMAPIDHAFASHWPEATVLSLLEEGLEHDLASGRATRAALDARISDLADYAMQLGPDAMLFTCSSFARGVEAVAARLPVPVLKPNQAMFDAALAIGGRIAMLYTFPSALDSMAREFTEAATVQDAEAELVPVLVEGALDALKRGDTATHDRLIADAAADVSGANALMLAQFSMTTATDAIRAATPLPVLTSPETAIAALRQSIGGGGQP